MAYIVWKQLKYGCYAYLQECLYNREKKGPETVSTYLGSTPKRAEIKLRRLIKDEKMLGRLINDLYRKKPEKKIPDDEKAKAVIMLTRLMDRFNNEEVREAINSAIMKIKEDSP